MARSAGVSKVVGAVGNRPGGSAETDGSISDKIEDGVRGGVGRGADQGHWRRQGRFSGSKQVKWSGEEDD